MTNTQWKAVFPNDYNEQQREAFQDAINESVYCDECMSHVDEVDGACGECGLELTASK